VLERGTMPAADRELAVERQKQIIQAVVSGTGWEKVAADVRERVDTPWYRSYLLFDPARVLSKMRQPVLVVHGDLDREVPPHHGEQLAKLAQSRPKGRGADLVRLPGLNHLLARATTGEPDEYGRLADRVVDPEATTEIAAWLRRTFAPPEPRK
jgi:fermentation-respiration switch protein FrsA (DUF1100 family)